MKERVYWALVRRVPGIRDRYQQKRKEAGRIPALLYLLWLNIQYYLLFRRSLEQPALCFRRRIRPVGAEKPGRIRPGAFPVRRDFL